MSSPRNTVQNFGIIQATEAGSAPGIGPGSAPGIGPVIGSFNDIAIDFVNEANARILGDLDFQNGNDRVTLFPGSIITGALDGGGGTNTLILDGAAGSSDSLSGSLKNFQILNKAGPGAGTLTGAVASNGGQ